jgi:hypothetical protein
MVLFSFLPEEIFEMMEKENTKTMNKNKKHKKNQQ